MTERRNERFSINEWKEWKHVGSFVFMFLCLSIEEPLVVEAMKTFAELTDQARWVWVSCR